MAARVLERHVTSDGSLVLIVLNDGTGDIAIGFEGQASHVHADQLAEMWRVSEEEAVRRYVGDIVEGRVPIAMCRVNGALDSVWAVAWPADTDAKTYSKYQPPNERIAFRYWDGTPWEPA